LPLEVKIRRKLKGFALDVSFRTDREVMGLLGASGSGKSMTLRCIAGIDRPDEGRIVLNGEVLYDSEKKISLPPQKRKIGYLFQNYALFPTMTAEENIGISLKCPGDEKAARVAEMIRKYRLEGLEKRTPAELSGGQQQRVALARMLITDPKVIMLDEPFSAMDAFLREQMLQELLSMLQEYKGEVLMVSHSRDDIYKCCRNLTIISSGKSLMSGDTKEIFRNPVLKETCRLTGCKNISPAKKTGDRKIFAEDWKLELETAEDVPDDLTAVGIRGHMIRRSDPEAQEGNCFHARQTGMVEAPFEYQYLVENAKGGKPIWWMVRKEESLLGNGQGFDGILHLPPESLMLLKD
jgi:molybdate transport system ATP-binding protein